MAPISTMASPLEVSYPNNVLISFTVYYRIYSSEGGDKRQGRPLTEVILR